MDCIKIWIKDLLIGIILKYEFRQIDQVLHTAEFGGNIHIVGFPGRSDSEESACNAGDQGLIPGLGRSH